MSLSHGTKLGHFEVIAPIGAGGMGEVYEARDTRLDRTVAIKVLPEHLAESPERKARFEREAKAISQLNHPHICTLYDVGEQDGIDFIVMEYIEGETLAERLKKGAFKLDQALEYGIQIADALDRAHRAGIVHRDLKPGNVMLTKSGVKLLDFGLARLLEGDADSETSDAPTRQKNLTQEEAIIGTLQYMAPEQLERRGVDARTDIFALGLVLYEMATGNKAFEGTSQASLIGAILKDEPPPVSDVVRMSPSALDRIVQTCLAKEPDERWQSAADVARQLDWVSDARTTTVATTSRGAIVAAAIAGGLVGAIILSLILRTQPASSRLVSKFGIAFPDVDSVQGFAFMPNGRHLAFLGRRDGRSQVFYRALDEETATPIEGTQNAYALFVSPGGEWIGYADASEIKKVSTLGGGAPLTIANHTGSFLGGAWSERGDIYFGTQGSALWRVSASGGEPEAFGALVEGEIEHSWPAMLPGGEALLFETRRASTDFVALRRLTGPATHEILLQGSAPRYVPTGHIVFRRGNTLMAARFDVRTLSVSGEPRPVLQQVRSSSYFNNLSFSRDGTLLYFSPSGAEAALTWVDRDGHVTPFSEELLLYRYPRLSPDGRSLAVNIGGDRGDIWIFDLEHGRRRRLTTSGANHAAWSPDGARLVYGATAPTGGFDLHLQPVEDSTATEVLLATYGMQTPQSWSDDGRVVAFTQEQRGGSLDIAVLREGEDTATPLLATPFHEGGPKFSPDGRFLAFTSNETGRFEVYVTDYPDAKRMWPISTGGGTEPMWSRDGRELFFRQDDRMMAVEVQTTPTFIPGEGRVLFEGFFSQGGFSGNANYDVSVDGERFVMIQDARSSGGSVYLVMNWFTELERLVPADD